MDKTTKVILILSVVSFVSLVFVLLALHDISHDYLSMETLHENSIVAGDAGIPEWASCKGEWAVLQVGFAVQAVFIVSVFLYGIRTGKKED